MDRADAGRQLAAVARELCGNATVVLGLPRGGVPVAYQLSRVLKLPLDVLLVRKLGVPFHRELAMGAVGEEGVRILNADVVRRSTITAEQLAAVDRAERIELARKAALYRDVKSRIDLNNMDVVIVDDGIATGATARAACQVAHARGAASVVVAAPVVSPSAAAALSQTADHVIAVATPQWFSHVGAFYEDFEPVADREVLRLLSKSL
ncbi:phosphoribosyltransferase [Jatrophihabitans sp. DSM 45814]